MFETLFDSVAAVTRHRAGPLLAWISTAPRSPNAPHFVVDSLSLVHWCGLPQSS